MPQGLESRYQALDSEEDQKSLEALDAVGDALHDADLDIAKRRIIWSDGERLSVDQTAERIHKLIRAAQTSAGLKVTSLVGWKWVLSQMV